MFNIRRLDLKALDMQTIRSFEAMTLPRYRCCLRSEQPDGIADTIIVAIAAESDGKPAGLLLATYFKHIHLAEIHSVFVEEKSRGTDIGSELLTLLEIELVLLKCYEVTIAYHESDACALFLESILKKRNWTKPVPFMIHCKFDVKAFRANWFIKDLKLSADFISFPWQELTTDDRKKLEFQIKQGSIPAHVSPFLNEAAIEPINSLGLRYKGDVVGWMITLRESIDTIRYFALYIQAQFQSQGEAIKLLCESIKLQQASNVPWGVLEVNIPQSSPRWLKFINRRLAPHALEVSYTLLSRKSL